MKASLSALALALLVFNVPAHARENQITDPSAFPIEQGIYITSGGSCSPSYLESTDLYFAYDGKSLHYYESSCEISSFWNEGTIYFMDAYCSAEGETFLETLRFNISSRTTIVENGIYGDTRYDHCPGTVHKPR